MRRRLQIRLSTTLVLLALAACGGGGGGNVAPNPPPPPAPPPPPPPPAPVATVTVTPPSASLVPPQTQALTVATLDASGNTLTGRTVTWTTSAAAVATLSSAGLVTAVGGGNATITATSEGKTGTAAISVADGAVVGQTGGSVTAAGGAVKMDIPAGAVTGPVSVTVTPATNQPAFNIGTYGVGGTAYTFGPEGTTFTAPVTVTVKYDPARMPAWALPADLALYHYANGAWVLLPNLTVDATAHTVSARTTSFSPFTVGVRLPPATLTPAIGSVNINQRSAVFTATIPGHPNTGLQYAWATTGRNGAIGAVIGNTGQYIMTQATLPPGDLDQIQVIIRGNIDPTQPNVVVPLASAEALVNANLTFTYDALPDLSNVAFAATKTVDAHVHNADGSIYNGPAGLPVLITWTSSQIHGSLDVHNPAHKGNSTQGIYTAKPANQSAALPPRIDQFTVDFYVGYWKTYTHVQAATPVSFQKTVEDSVVAKFDVKSGTAKAFMEVEPKTAIGNFSVRTSPSPGGSCVTAVAAVPKVTGATSYDLTVTGIVGSPNGTTFHKVFSGATNTGSILDIFNASTFWGVPMDGGCATTQAAITFRQNLYQSQYGTASFVIKTTP